MSRPMFVGAVLGVFVTGCAAGQSSFKSWTPEGVRQ
jgi:hypothetical protein